MVNTFVTSSNSTECARNLDNVRLNQQINEAHMIINTLEGRSKSYINHPAVKMWMSYVEALKDYCNKCTLEWTSRGKNNTRIIYSELSNTIVYPYWFNMPTLHLAYKCSLLRKNPTYYNRVFKLKDDEMYAMNYGYIWPSKAYSKIQIKLGISDSDMSNDTNNSLHNKIVEEMYNSSLTDICETLCKYTQGEIETWLKDRTKSPKGRKIAKDKATYKELEAAARHYGLI